MIIENVEVRKTWDGKDSMVKVTLSKAQAKVLQSELEYLCTECDDHGRMSTMALTIDGVLNLVVEVDPEIDARNAEEEIEVLIQDDIKPTKISWWKTFYGDLQKLIKKGK